MMVWHLGLPRDALQNGPTRYEVTIDGAGPYGSLDQLRYIIDLNEYASAATTVPGTLYGVTSSIKQVTAQLTKIANKIDRIAGSTQ